MARPPDLLQQPAQMGRTTYLNIVHDCSWSTARHSGCFLCGSLCYNRAMEITNLAPSHAVDAARLHIAGQPGTFLTDLGLDVLSLLYRTLPQSASGFGFAMVETSSVGQPGEDTQQQPHSHAMMNTHRQPSIDDGITQEAICLGFVAATTDTGHLFIELGTRHFFQFSPKLLKRYIRRPRLILQTMQTLLYPLVTERQRSDQKRERLPSSNSAVSAELLSIMVEPNHRGQGIGGKLLQQLVTSCQTRGVSTLDVTVDAQNQRARQFYSRHGFTEKNSFVLYGRLMCCYEKSIPSEDIASANQLSTTP